MYPLCVCMHTSLYCIYTILFRHAHILYCYYYTIHNNNNNTLILYCVTVLCVAQAEKRVIECKLEKATATYELNLKKLTDTTVRYHYFY